MTQVVTALLTDRRPHYRSTKITHSSYFVSGPNPCPTVELSYPPHPSDIDSMPVPLPDDAAYISSEDDDFQPAADEPQHDSADEPSSSDSDAAAAAGPARGPKPRLQSRAHPTGPPKSSSDATSINPATAEDLDSGDEATIRRGKRRNLRSADDDDDTSEPWVKTRAQRRQEDYAQHQQQHPSALLGAVTVDIDALWASMNQSGGMKPPPAPLPESPSSASSSSPKPSATTTSKPSDEDPSTILITRTTTFAGQTHTEHKRVPRSSAEAQLYLSQTRSKPLPSTSDPNGPPSHHWPHATPPTRPLRKPSRFEPPPSQLPPPTSSSQTLRIPLRAVTINAHAHGRGVAGTGEVQKLNTVEMSKRDWARFVDGEGLKEELEGVGRGREGYLGRMDFLGRVTEREEEGRRRG